VEYICGNAWMGYWATSWRTARGFEFFNALESQLTSRKQQYFIILPDFILFVQQQLDMKNRCKSKDVVLWFKSVCCKATKIVMERKWKYWCFLEMVCFFKPLKELNSASRPPSRGSSSHPSVLPVFSNLYICGSAVVTKIIFIVYNNIVYPIHNVNIATIVVIIT